MKTIYKYTIGSAFSSINAPVERFLKVDVQEGGIRVWAIIETNKPDRHFAFATIGTGWNLDEIPHFDKMEYLDSIKQYGESLIWHIFYVELTEPYEVIVEKIKNGTIQ